ncbi:MAG: hypothetical protein PHX21_13805 [bacterium]|nr:hypothetical protein [bacterium]
MTKYKVVKPGARYRHVGNGVWRIYSIANDRKKTGKLTTDKKKWAKQPHKLDFQGIDTSGACKIKRLPKKKTGVTTIIHNKGWITEKSNGEVREVTKVKSIKKTEDGYIIKRIDGSLIEAVKGDYDESDIKNVRSGSVIGEYSTDKAYKLVLGFSPDYIEKRISSLKRK